MIIELEKDDFFKALISTEKLVFVDFYATWCEPCKWLDSILLDVLKELPDLDILKVDTEIHITLTQFYELKSVPVLILFKNEEILWRMNGFLTASELVKKIKEFST
jgi:thioredoxin 1